MAVVEEGLRTPAPGARPVVRGRAVRLGGWLAAGGWASMAMMWATGSADLFGHDQAELPGVIAFAPFLAGWIVMIAAMMLPSSLPTLRRIDRASPAGASASRLMIGYFLAWGAFGMAAFAGDLLLHRVVEHAPLLAQRPSLIMAGAAMFAGVAELLGRPAPPAMPVTRPGAGSIAMGRAHAVDRIRRCWPLMLFAMALGMGSALGMLALSAVMALELRPEASVVLRLAGLLLVGVGAALLIEPGWMPALIGR